MKETVKAGFAAVVVLATTSSGLNAAGQPWACQYTADAGLRWENGSWKSTAFREGQPFVLVQNGDILTRKSAATALVGDSEYHMLISCSPAGFDAQPIICRDTLGSSLVFSPTTGQGGMSLILGTIQNNPKRRDTLHVKHFICQKY
jgi:hypothetical protein